MLYRLYMNIVKDLTIEDSDDFRFAYLKPDYRKIILLLDVTLNDIDDWEYVSYLDVYLLLNLLVKKRNNLRDLRNAAAYQFVTFMNQISNSALSISLDQMSKLFILFIKYKKLKNNKNAKPKGINLSKRKD